MERKFDTVKLWYYAILKKILMSEAVSIFIFLKAFIMKAITGL